MYQRVSKQVRLAIEARGSEALYGGGWAELRETGGVIPFLSDLGNTIQTAGKKTT